MIPLSSQGEAFAEVTFSEDLFLFCLNLYARFSLLLSFSVSLFTSLQSVAAPLFQEMLLFPPKGEHCKFSSIPCIFRQWLGRWAKTVLSTVLLGAVRVDPIQSHLSFYVIKEMITSNKVSKIYFVNLHIKQNHSLLIWLSLLTLECN